MPSEKSIKNLVLWLIFIIFVSFSLAVILFILSGDNWFTATAGWSESVPFLTGFYPL